MFEPEPHDRKALQARVEAGWAPDYVLFWGHSASRDAPLGKECLSQWYPARFTLDGETYATAEHYKMARKAVLFGDAEMAAQIRASSEPAEVKALGRKVRGFDAARWEEHRFRIVAAGSRAKFSQNAALRAFLVGTGARVLVEASPSDAIWGIGVAESDPRARDPRRWPGLNLLGFALMHARALLAAG
jgi:hypothetical protein